MTGLIFKIDKAGEKGRSPIEIILINNSKKYKKTMKETDKLLLALDKVLKFAKLKIDQVKNIRIISHKEAGLTSQRIVRAIKQALDF